MWHAAVISDYLEVNTWALTCFTLIHALLELTGVKRILGCCVVRHSCNYAVAPMKPEVYLNNMENSEFPPNWENRKLNNVSWTGSDVTVVQWKVFRYGVVYNM